MTVGRRRAYIVQRLTQNSQKLVLSFGVGATPNLSGKRIQSALCSAWLLTSLNERLHCLQNFRTLWKSSPRELVAANLRTLGLGHRLLTRSPMVKLPSFAD